VEPEPEPQEPKLFAYNICNKKVKKIKNERQTFLEIRLLLTLKRQDFGKIFCCRKTVQILS
jgi:hypothetical protein